MSATVLKLTKANRKEGEASTRNPGRRGQVVPSFPHKERDHDGYLYLDGKPADELHEIICDAPAGAEDRLEEMLAALG